MTFAWLASLSMRRSSAVVAIFLASECLLIGYLFNAFGFNSAGTCFLPDKTPFCVPHHPFVVTLINLATFFKYLLPLQLLYLFFAEGLDRFTKVAAIGIVAFQFGFVAGAFLKSQEVPYSLYREHNERLRAICDDKETYKLSNWVACKYFGGTHWE